MQERFSFEYHYDECVYRKEVTKDLFHFFGISNNNLLGTQCHLGSHIVSDPYKQYCDSVWVRCYTAHHHYIHNKVPAHIPTDACKGNSVIPLHR